MMTIKVLGPGCCRCNDLERLCMNVLAENDIDADLQKITDVKDIAKHGIISTPALIINDKIVFSGYIPSKAALLHQINEYNK